MSRDRPNPGHGAITLRGVSKRYGEERAVDAIDLAIGAGEFFSLLGPSGSGKTTTLLMISGFAELDEGLIEVDGKDIARLPPQRRGFGMVFQSYAIFPHLNVFENVAFPLRARRVDQRTIADRAAWALNLVRLGGFEKRFAHQLSGGQQQRVAIARAIVFEPHIVLMDEPLGALDKNLRYEMQVEIKEIQRRLGMTVVYVTHDQEEAMNMSDRIAILNRGRIEQIGVPAQVYAQPANAFVGRFLGEANILEGAVAAIVGSIASVRIGALSLRATAREAWHVQQRAALFVRPERIAIDPPPGREEELNRVAGRVRRVSFLGNVVRYLVTVAPAADLIVDVQNRGGAPLAPDTPVSLAWAVADSLLLGSGPCLDR